jgi:hypothetical protein
MTHDRSCRDCFLGHGKIWFGKTEGKAAIYQLFNFLLLYLFFILYNKLDCTSMLLAYFLMFFSDLILSLSPKPKDRSPENDRLPTKKTPHENCQSQYFLK